MAGVIPNEDHGALGSPGQVDVAAADSLPRFAADVPVPAHQLKRRGCSRREKEAGAKERGVNTDGN